MSNTNDGGPAFPMAHGETTEQRHGMSLRDYFAGQALVALIGKEPLRDALGQFGEKWDVATLEQFRNDIAISAYAYADAALIQRYRGGYDLMLLQAQANLVPELVHTLGRALAALRANGLGNVEGAKESAALLARVEGGGK